MSGEIQRWQEGARRVLEQVSPSQIENFERCPRVWFYRSILRVPTTTTRAQARGTAIHGEVEHLLETGDTRPAWFIFDDATARWRVDNGARPIGEAVEDLRPIVEALVPHLPDREAATTSMEQWVPRFAFYEGGPVVNGRYDAYEDVRPRPRLTDVKSRSDFRYCKSPAELAEDVQLTSYAIALAHANPDDVPEEVTLRHLYAKTKGRAVAQSVEVVVTVDELKARWRRTAETVRQMAAWAAWAAAQETEPGIERVPPNTAACGDYGGCEHRRRCGFDTDEDAPGARRATTRKATEDTMSANDILARMRANLEKKQQPAATAPAPTPPATPPSEPPRVATTAGEGQVWQRGEVGHSMRPPETDDERVAIELARFRRGELRIDPTDQASVWAGTARVEAHQLPANVRRARDLYLAELRAVRPPDAGAPVDPPRAAAPPAAAPPAVPDGAEKPKRPRKPKETPAPGAGAGAISAEEAAGSTSSAATATVDELRSALKLAQQNEASSRAYAERVYQEAADQKASDAAKIAGLEAALASSQGALAGAQQALSEASLRGAVDAPPGALPEFVLYVDCTPTKGPEVMDAEEWVGPIAASVAAEKQVADWRLIPYTAEGELVARISQVVAADATVLPRAMRVCGSSRMRAALLEALVPRATQVVRGVR